MIKTNSIETAKLLIKKSSPPIEVFSQDYNFNKKIAEYGKFNILIFNHTLSKSKLKKIESGINDYIARLMKKNNIQLGIELGTIRKLTKEGKASFLVSLREILKLVKKHNIPIYFYGVRDKKNARDFLFSLGTSTHQTIYF